MNLNVIKEALYKKQIIESMDYNEVVNWAYKRGLNTDTPENWKEAAMLMYEERNHIEK